MLPPSVISCASPFDHRAALQRDDRRQPRRLPAERREPVAAPSAGRQERGAAAVRRHVAIVHQRADLQVSIVDGSTMKRSVTPPNRSRDVRFGVAWSSRRGLSPNESVPPGNATPSSDTSLRGLVLKSTRPNAVSALLDDVRSSALRDVGHRNPLVVVLDRRHVVCGAVRRRSARVHPREDAFEPPEAGRREARTRHDALHAHRELVAAGAARDLHDAAELIAEGHRHRIAQRVDAAHRFERQVQRGIAGGRIGDVEAVEQHRRFVRAGAAKLHQAVGAAHHRRQQRQRLARLQPRRRQARHRLRR